MIFSLDNLKCFCICVQTALISIIIYINIVTAEIMFEKLAWTFYLDSICFQSALLSCSLSCPACCLFLTLGSFPKEYVVYKGIFQQGQEHKHKASHQVNIYCLDVGNLWQGLSEVGADGGHGQHSCDSCERKKKALTNKTGKEIWMWKA